jgi:glyoxylase-like metal-dependent hydrolase (beta-lactamase superfamily II)
VKSVAAFEGHVGLQIECRQLPRRPRRVCCTIIRGTFLSAAWACRWLVKLARATIAAYHDRTRSLTGSEALPGISLLSEPGHTPGYSGWLIASGDDSLLIWGDIVHMPGVQFPQPGVGLGFDIDGDQAIASRRRIFDMVATDRLAVTGMRLDFPCFGHVAKAAEGYAFIPNVWTPTL